ncbi:hypothetical protein E2C01_028261 [Portunus trituberculatus]|uniref:Uncharacterized protein n=1 Tax=Portunus trituberculatus TaxID=210409 RepID=A0A5B7ENM1_PORTR|nr:hypothetical protein [Portunus trituberculatus]
MLVHPTPVAAAQPPITDVSAALSVGCSCSSHEGGAGGGVAHMRAVRVVLGKTSPKKPPTATQK